MAQFMVTAVGSDRPGIVAAVTTPLADLGCNLEDSSSTILRGHFAMMVVVSGPESLSADALAEAIRKHAAPLGVTVTVGPVTLAEAGPEANHLLSVYGADRPGIVRDIAQFLAERQIDITDLQSRLIGRRTPLYVALVEIAVPAGQDMTALQTAVRDLGEHFDVEITLRDIEQDAL
ncbi:MAG: ACT domain-containing protein [Candidatus Sericytochromatia bacterium]|nr:ACT domain-containing protein [Candidatus Sericytochromatia bacterium]